VPGGSVWLAIGRTTDGYLFRFRRFANFHWAPGQQQLTCYLRPGVQMKTARHLLLDQVLPILAGDRGDRNGLHGSAVVIEQGAVVFVGETGRGKSTLAASFGSAGHPVITDDCVVLKADRGNLHAIPTYPSLRLWQDAAETVSGHVAVPSSPVAEYSAKLRIDTRSLRSLSFYREAAPLRCVYVLERLGPRRSVEIERLSQREAFIQLIRFGFRLDPHHSRDLAREMEQVAELSSTIPVRRLRIPWRLELLSDVREAVLNDLASPAPHRRSRSRAANGTE